MAALLISVCMIPCRPPLINTDPNHHPCRHVLQICQRHNIRCLRWPRSSPTLALIRVTTRDPTNAQSLNYFLHLKPKSTTLVIYSEIYRFWLLYESPNCRLVLSLAEKELLQWNSPPTFFYPSPILISASSSPIPFSPHRYLFTRPLDIPQTSQAAPPSSSSLVLPTLKVYGVTSCHTISWILSPEI